MSKVKILCGLVILLTWVGYYLNFGVNGTLSQKTEVWGQFGDYIGGVVNPILSFITIFLLIKSIGLQRESNDCLVGEIKRQEKLEEYKKFELRFFHLIESQEVNFSRFNVVLRPASPDDQVVTILKSGEAVSYIEDSLLILIEAKKDAAIIGEWLDSIDEDSSYFSIVRRFYVILKLINDNTIKQDERMDMYETLMNLTDSKIICMIAILCVYYEWDIIKYIRACDILNREGIYEYMEKFKVVGI
ncbi:hypothetical protein ACMSWY_000139 [Cronobacter turicensis]